jgi:hypothetical protein
VRETLEDVNLAPSPSDTQLRTLDAISLVLDRRLHRNGEDTLTAELMLTDLFDAGLEAAKGDPQKLEQKLRETTAAVQFGLQIVGG